MNLKAFTTETQRHGERQKQKQQHILSSTEARSAYNMVRAIKSVFKVFSVSLCLCGEVFIEASL